MVILHTVVSRATKQERLAFKQMVQRSAHVIGLRLCHDSSSEVRNVGELVFFYLLGHRQAAIIQQHHEGTSIQVNAPASVEKP